MCLCARVCVHMCVCMCVSTPRSWEDVLHVGSVLGCFLVPSCASVHPHVSNTRCLGSECCVDACAICLGFPVLVCSGLLLCPSVLKGICPWCQVLQLAQNTGGDE